MALSIKREGFKHVPWFSLSEWHQVYKQIYSNDTSEQTKGYENLLMWKARIPKLPVGADCTLSIIQVCLRDRELTPKIDSTELPVYYEHDLCLMYSTTIMRVLNHISHIGQLQQTSLFQIAKQLKIPEWIVNLRHDAAHGHELPSINLLRLAANILLTWLHEEYWAAEAKNTEDYFTKEENIEIEEPEESQALIDLIELWIAVGLYNQAKYVLVKDVPDVELRETLQSLRTYALDVSWNDNVEENVKTNLQHEKKYTLTTARAILLTEISRYLEDNELTPNKEELVLNLLFDNEAFLPCQSFVAIFQKGKALNDWKEDKLPLNMIQFWQDFILLLQKKGMLQNLILKLIKLIDEEQESRYKKLIASLWINCIARGFQKKNTAGQVTQTLKHALKNNKRNKVSLKLQPLKVKNIINHDYPWLKRTLSFNASDNAPNCLTDLNFITELILNVNEFSVKFIPTVLVLAFEKIPKSTKQNLIKLIRIYMGNETIRVDSGRTLMDNKIHTVEDLENLCYKQNEKNLQVQMEEDTSYVNIPEVGDQTIRNSDWKLAPINYDWSICPMGILPWQLNSMETVNSVTVIPSKCIGASTESNIIPGIIDGKSLNVQSKINWEVVLRKKKRTKRKLQKGDADIMINRAIEILRKQQ